MERCVATDVLGVNVDALGRRRLRIVVVAVGGRQQEHEALKVGAPVVVKPDDDLVQRCLT